jgi:anaerobic magnesium-protoporphyrin IX monomethyl ester cyclase
MSNRKKIVLYNPASVYFDMPLALMALGSQLDKSRFQVVIIDARIEKNAHEKALKELENALCFGVTVLTGKPIEDAISITQQVKENNPDLPTIWGGWHPSIFPESTLKDEESIDIIVQGQGEFIFKDLVEAFAAGLSINDIKGICFRTENNDIIKTPQESIIDINHTLSMDYSLIDVEEYFKRKGRRQLDYISSIGCTYRCAFCADPFVFKRKFSALSSQRVADEIEMLYKQFSFSDINFQDDTFFTYPERILSLSKELINRNIKIQWTATMRADQGDRISQEDFNLLADSGLKRLLVGVESGSQEMMDKLKKDIKKEQVIHTAEKCIKAGIHIQFPFIVGLPDESDKEFEESINFAIELLNMSDLFSPSFFYFKPYPGSNITEKATNDGLQLPQTLQEWVNFDFYKTHGNWISREKERKIEKIKFYIRIIVSKNKFAFFLRGLARFRLNKMWLSFPIEKIIFSFFKPDKDLV